MKMINADAARVGRSAGIVWVVLAAAVAVLSLIPAREYPAELALLNDKAGHAAAYALLAGIPCWFFRRHVAGAVLGVVALGVALELLQMAVPGRSFEWNDVLSNLAGTAAGAMAGLLVRRRRGGADGAPR